MWVPLAAAVDNETWILFEDSHTQSFRYEVADPPCTQARATAQRIFFWYCCVINRKAAIKPEISNPCKVLGLDLGNAPCPREFCWDALV